MKRSELGLEKRDAMQDLTSLYGANLDKFLQGFEKRAADPREAPYRPPPPSKFT